jgi:uncharacterized protein YbaR (Trm112 family)/SAM-dependent methyltransferase
MTRLACPHCGGSLAPSNGATTRTALRCGNCGKSYPVAGGVPVLLDDDSATTISEARSGAENVRLRSRMAHSPLMRFANATRPPHPFKYMRWRISRKMRMGFSALAASDTPDPVFLDIGSGILGGLNAEGLSPYVRDHVVPLEIAPTAGVGIVGDAHKLPWRTASVDGVLIQGVLEHVVDPQRIVAEIFRVLRPGGPVYAEVPFQQHFHLDPLDLRRYTVDGFEQLFQAFERVDSGVCAGPAAALTDILTEFPALLFKRPAAYWGVKWISGWLFSPLQLLDAVWMRSPRAHIAAAAVYFLGRRPV